MFKKLDLRIFSVVLLCCMLISICPVKAASEYTLEIEGEPIFSELLPYSEGNEIMVPLYATTEALGGINLNAPIGDAHRTAILNDRALYIITGMNYYMSLPLDESVSFESAENLDDYLNILTEKIMTGEIPVSPIDFPYSERNGDIYIPLNIYTSALNLKADKVGSSISFRMPFTTYRSDSSNVRFQLSIPSKVYDGKPLTWDERSLQVLYNGEPVTDYYPLLFDYMYTSMDLSLEDVPADPINAGAYALSIRTNPNDPKYVGTGYFSFMIYPAELVLEAEDIEIHTGDAIPHFSYDVSGIVPGEAHADALTDEPVLTATAQNTNTPGTFTIRIDGGQAGENYIIKDRLNGTLTISDTVQSAVIQIICIDSDTGSVLHTSRQTEYEGENIAVYAPELDGYRVSGPEKQQLTVSDGAFVRFYYTDTNNNETPSTEDDSGLIRLSPYITGYPDGTFRPENPITRSECAAVLYRVLLQMDTDIAPTTTASRFRDVTSSQWYSTAVSTLSSLGILNGYTDGTFRPNQFMSRAEFTASVLRLAGISPTTTLRSSFSDVPSAHWAAPYVTAAVKHGLISGYQDGSFRPEQPISRAEVVSILNKVSGRDTCVSYDDATIFVDVSPSHWAFDSILSAANNSYIPGG